ncbi:hypothetical protein [Mycoplasmopsis canis]|nr:hypothetical protein [Mycoplasmopsis canis]
MKNHLNDKFENRDFTQNQKTKIMSDNKFWASVNTNDVSAWTTLEANH